MDTMTSLGTLEQTAPPAASRSYHELRKLWALGTLEPLDAKERAYMLKLDLLAIRGKLPDEVLMQPGFHKAITRTLEAASIWEGKKRSPDLYNAELAAKGYTRDYARCSHLYLSPRYRTGREIPVSHLRTQKAKGLMVVSWAMSGNLLASLGMSIPCSLRHVNLPHGVMLPDSKPAFFEVETYFSILPGGPLLLPAFARPCPLTPRHGFLDSRPVRRFEEVMYLLDEVRKIDPQGELILMTPLRGTVSAVVSNGGVSWGRGHNGATLGNATTFPTPTSPGHMMQTLGLHFIPPEVHGIKTAPYIELVEQNNKAVIVQLRDGPVAPFTKDFVPVETRVQTVIRPEMGVTSLLEFEQTINEAKDLPGVVVHLPRANLSCHYAVQAIQAGLPVITKDAAPKAGSILRPSAVSTVLPTAVNLQEFAEEIHRWGNTPLWTEAEAADVADSAMVTGKDKSLANMVITAVATIHASPFWDWSPYLLRARAFAVTVLARIIIAACVGEARHGLRDSYPHGIRATRGPASKETMLAEVGLCERTPAIDWAKAGLPIPSDFQPSKGVPFKRSMVYYHLLNLPLSCLWSFGVRAQYDLAGPGWGGSIGGTRWADSARMGVDLLEAMDSFTREPTHEHQVQMMQKANVVLHSVHNCGFVIDKWVSRDLLTRLADAPFLGFMNVVAGKLATGLLLPAPYLKEDIISPQDRQETPPPLPYLTPPKETKEKKKLSSDDNLGDPLPSNQS